MPFDLATEKFTDTILLRSTLDDFIEVLGNALWSKRLCDLFQLMGGQEGLRLRDVDKRATVEAVGEHLRSHARQMFKKGTVRWNGREYVLAEECCPQCSANRGYYFVADARVTLQAGWGRRPDFEIPDVEITRMPKNAICCGCGGRVLLGGESTPEMNDGA